MFNEFTRAFNNADLLYVTDIYPAGERPIAGVDAAALVRAIRHHGHQAVHYAPERAQLAATLASEARAGDVVIALGAGDINRVLPLVEREIAARAP